jgi:hypothetical protein
MDEKQVVTEETYRAIGRFIFQFSQLEYTLRHYVAAEIKLDDKYFSAIMTHDFALLCTVAFEVLSPSMSEDGQGRLRDTISECRKLNDVRVRVAHGLWVPFMEGGTVHHVARTSLKSNRVVEQASELEQKADEAQSLRGKFEELMWERWSKRALRRGKPRQEA